MLRKNHPPIINLSLRLFLYQHVKDHVVIFSEAKVRLSRMQSQACLSFAEAMTFKHAGEKQKCPDCRFGYRDEEE